MFRDELKQPLRRKGLAERLWARRPGLLFCAYVATFGGLAGAATWARLQPMPFAGEPIVMVSIPAAVEIAPPPEVAEERTPAPSENEQVVDTASTDPLPNDTQQNVQIEPDVQQDTYQQDAAIIVSPHRPLTPAPQDNVTETMSYGPLPRVAGNGETASHAYERTTPLNVIHSDAPKIAIMLGGMGLNKKLTQRAVKELPADVTFAFAPYGDDLQEQVNRARADGHEVFLQVPLEPVGFPVSNPGPKTLMGDGSEAENIDALRWHMSRFAGYAGVVNYMGGRFLAMPKAITPMLSELNHRGIPFLEDGSLALSSTENAAKAMRAKVKRAQVVIDANPSPEAIMAALTQLEEQATGTGFAIGTGSGLEVTIDTLREWAKAAAERGIILVPMTASFKGRTG
jgi:polysaccharide deacetylase 2 family uncharacterized protein YibQ